MFPQLFRQGQQIRQALARARFGMNHHIFPSDNGGNHGRLNGRGGIKQGPSQGQAGRFGQFQAGKAGHGQDFSVVGLVGSVFLKPRGGGGFIVVLVNCTVVGLLWLFLFQYQQVMLRQAASQIRFATVAG